MLRWVAACSHMRTFIAGTISTGLSVASSNVVASSSAMPAAARAIRLAVAGHTTTRSAARESWIWPIAASSSRSHRLVRTFSPASADSESGVTKRAPFSVSTGSTRAPARPSSRTSSSVLKAAMPPLTIRRMVLPCTVVRIAQCCQ